MEGVELTSIRSGVTPTGPGIRQTSFLEHVFVGVVSWVVGREIGRCRLQCKGDTATIPTDTQINKVRGRPAAVPGTRSFYDLFVGLECMGCNLLAGHRSLTNFPGNASSQLSGQCSQALCSGPDSMWLMYDTCDVMINEPRNHVFWRHLLFCTIRPCTMYRAFISVKEGHTALRS